SWYLDSPPFSVRNGVYLEQAVELGSAVALMCLTEAGVPPEAVTDLWWLSSTGLATPSPDVYLGRLLKLSPRVRRTPVWGLGCAGGAVGLSRGLATAAADPDACVLVVVAELCSLTFLSRDRRKSNLIATVLFADGAAAALILGHAAFERWRKRREEPFTERGGVWEWVESSSTHWPDTTDMMGWDIGDEGWRVVFSKSIPDFLRQHGGELLHRTCRLKDGREQPIDHWVVHPGGAKVLAAYEEVLGIERNQLASGYAVLREYGNMSAPTVLFVLEHLNRQGRLQDGGTAAVLALGPGFSGERVVLQWRSVNSFRG
ncbi:MAG: type III polyketide synthase, partial [Alicyclobacillaceae bacterium]|nr:type III polyketide synthase [Alicyclobacillaceae bacterium]